ncbi:RHS repeat-associated core domain containing protein [Nitzschia inconspicua]|uniref:non-specific serine/threonine protein kinase n=1 Tax=Nitzschia inconspicua TaxID=303405 RepID=A0A9K3PZY2_9STRA|nr:RHS repeat-associated core domain containing protein [Nitzschia inconspicua]
MSWSNDTTTPSSEEVESQGDEYLRSIQVSRSTATKRNDAGGTSSSEGPAYTSPCQWKRSKSQPSLTALDSSMTDQGCSSIDPENGQSMNTSETTSECTDSGGGSTFKAIPHHLEVSLKPPYNNNQSLVAIPFPDPTYKRDEDWTSPTLSPTTFAVGTNFTELDRSSPQYQAIVWLSGHFPMNTTLEDLLLSTYFALATLYFTANGKSWRNNSGWMSSEEHLCHWTGVTCIQTEIPTLVGLNLSNNGLSGTLPTEIGLLTNITSLSLSHNHLMGPVPSELGYLQQLQQLHLDRNRFSGSLPVEITTNLPRLDVASFHGNDLVAGLRNFALCNSTTTPESLLADCAGAAGAAVKTTTTTAGLETGGRPKVLCPCCTTCCYEVADGRSTRSKDKLVCITQQPWTLDLRMHFLDKGLLVDIANNKNNRSSSVATIQTRSSTVSTPTSNVVNNKEETEDDDINNNEQKQEKNKKKKFLAVHVGVCKTGTSAIQQETKLNLVDTLAHRDGAAWVGKWAGPHAIRFRSFEECLKHVSNDTAASFTKQQGDHCWNETIMSATTTKLFTDSANTSIVSSFEEYSFKGRDVHHKDIQRLRQYFGRYLGHDVILLATYRRYHEWIVSSVAQTYHRNCLSTRDTSLKRLWPHQGGIPCKNPWTVGQQFVLQRNNSYYSFDSFVNIDTMLPEMRKIGFHLQVMNYHSKDYPSAMTQHFYCGMLRDYTPHTCQESLMLLSEKQQQAASNNTGFNQGGDKYIYDSIVLELAKRGWINTTAIQRHHARIELTDRHVNGFGKGVSDLPLICPPQSAYDRLLEKSLQLERLMSHELYGVDTVDPAIEAEHIAEFETKLYNKRGLCWVDMDLLFHNNDVTSYTEFLYGALNQTWGPPKRITMMS